MMFYKLKSLISIALVTACMMLVSFEAKAIIKIENPLTAQNFTELLNAIINFLFALSLGIAPMMIIVAGFYFVTAMGDPQKIATAKKIILWTLVGLLIVMCARGLIEFFKVIFGVKTS